jgi:hypothetical protein
MKMLKIDSIVEREGWERSWRWIEKERERRARGRKKEI